ncbi:hypothetical protein SRB5_55970 [Streptomyces sp. RB5]|uniref:Uncharacterized protein n=1 Tax=Streptomyces smaragdinus TaxID=2585196 RepID=A0A7K0CPK3_9ACTN|nr:hypothetical protein [Streptomyces smaragdinus]MQY15415.1 hypothetical protein [Streptomyces smaragdinus]
MIHDEDTLAAELDRVRRRPPAGSAPPVPAAFTAEVSSGTPEEYAARVREVLAAVLELACTVEFGDEDLPEDTIPSWFVSASGDTYSARTGGEPWSQQNWLFRFHPDEESRGWQFWDVVPAGPSQVRVLVDSWGESFFGSLELQWLLYAAGASGVKGPNLLRTRS